MKQGLSHRITSCFRSFFLVTLLLASTTQLFSQEPDIEAGKKLFNANCAACHKLNKKAVGPALRGVSQKYDKEWLYSWIKNSAAMIKDGDAQAVAIWEEYNRTAMTAFPQLSNADIDNIIAYTDYTPPAAATPVAAAATGAASGGSGMTNDLVLAALTLVFLLLVVMLFWCKKPLSKLSKQAVLKLSSNKSPREHPFGKPLYKTNFWYLSRLFSCC